MDYAMEYALMSDVFDEMTGGSYTLATEAEDTKTEGAKQSFLTKVGGGIKKAAEAAWKWICDAAKKIKDWVAGIINKIKGKKTGEKTREKKVYTISRVTPGETRYLTRLASTLKSTATNTINSAADAIKEGLKIAGVLCTKDLTRINPSALNQNVDNLGNHVASMEKSKDDTARIVDEINGKYPGSKEMLLGQIDVTEETLDSLHRVASSLEASALNVLRRTNEIADLPPEIAQMSTAVSKQMQYVTASISYISTAMVSSEISGLDAA